MDSEDEAQTFRHDDDSGDDYLDESDSSESDESTDVDRSRVDELVGDGGDRRDRPSGSRSRSRRGGTGEQQWVWELLADAETSNPKEWLMDFDKSSAGVKNIDLDHSFICQAILKIS